MSRRIVRCGLLVVVAMNCMAMMSTGGCPGGMSAPGDMSGDMNDGGTPGNTGQSAGIYVTNFGGQSMTVYSLDAMGDAAPIRTISGPNTELNGPIGIARDSQRRIYVANRSGGQVTVYAPGANGDAAPVSKLTDANMGSPEGIAIANTDEVFVTNAPTLGGLGGIAGLFHFPANATASDFNISGPNTGITVPVGVALDELRNIFVANAFGGTIDHFAPGQSGNQFPVRSFSPGGNTQSIAYGNASVLLGAGSIGINTYPSTASGNTMATGNIGNVGFTGLIHFDTDVTPPVIYVTDFFGNKVHIIQTVGVAPFLSVGSIRTIEGPSTGLQSPLGVLVVKT